MIKREIEFRTNTCMNYFANKEGIRDDFRAFENFFPTKEELSYHKFLLKYPCPAKHRKNPWIRKGNYMNVKVPCMIGHMFREHTYVDLKAPVNIMSRLYFNWIMSDELEPRRILITAIDYAIL